MPTLATADQQLAPNLASFDYERLAGALINAVVSQQFRQQGMTPQEASRAAGHHQMRHKAAGSTPNATLGHGPGGLFSAPGRDRAVFSALILPYAGMQSRLPVMPSEDTNPVFQILTGVTATTGSERTAPCDAPPQVGLAKLCETSLPFGLLARRSRTYDIRTFGRRVNRGELFDYQLVNTPFDGGTMLPSPTGSASMNEIVNNDLLLATWEMAVAWARDFARMIYTGNPSTDNTAGGGHKAFWGFNRLINDGYRDYETQVLCAAADSYLADFQGRTIAANSALFYSFVTFVYRRLRYVASRTGLSPAKWCIAMPYSMFWEASEVWPWASRQPNVIATATIGTGSTNFVDGGEMYAMQNEMRGDLGTYTGQYLLIDGERVEVVIDEAIPETSVTGGRFRAPMYFVPMTVKGNRPATYMEHFDYRGMERRGAIEASRFLSGGEFAFLSDDGRFLWLREPPTRGCAEMQAETEPRLCVRTPYIAARIDNVGYAPIAHEPSWDPSSEYHRNGGKTSVATPRLYPPSDE